MLSKSLLIIHLHPSYISSFVISFISYPTITISQFVFYQQVASLEVTWVVSDYNATPGTNELSITKGQQVEVIETSCPNDPDFCLVRLNSQSDDGVVQEGLVPISILKPQPGAQKSNSNNKKESDTLQEQGKNFEGLRNGFK